MQMPLDLLQSNNEFERREAELHQLGEMRVQTLEGIVAAKD